MKKISLSIATMLSLVCSAQPAIEKGKTEILDLVEIAKEVDKTAIPYGNNPVAGHYVNVGDAKIYYEVYGEGEPFVLLHGGGGAGSIYELHDF
ncbi:MAG: hypothetical protein LBF62_13425, partial [Tannerellaceae bacterium]|nr:hypothetical protein [Tannerellaceae bacterium]